MSIERVREQFRQWGIENRIQELDQSSATVKLAAQALGCEERQIAKTLAFQVEEWSVLVVASGDARIDNAKFKRFFHKKPHMIAKENVEHQIGHSPGGVCPFAVNPEVQIYLDISLRSMNIVYPACGSSNSCIRMTIEELEKITDPIAWVDVCKE